jgi:DNA-directed RNA polymerase specialized sigma subunit
VSPAAAFNDHGELEPTTDFDWDAVETKTGNTLEETEKAQVEAMVNVLRYVNLGNPKPRELKAIVCVLLHALRPEKTQAELAAEIGISQGRVSQLLIKFRAEMAGKRQF